MSILYNDEQQVIASQARRILDARADRQRQLALLERIGAFDQTLHDTAVEQGWLAMAVPEEHGGLGLGLVELGLVAQAWGAATAGTPFLTTNSGVTYALSAHGSERLARRWLPGLATGAVKGAVAFAEGNVMLPDPPQTVLEDSTLSGVKHGVTAGLAADIAVVWASHEGTPVLVLAELDGVPRQAIDSFDNSRLFADLTFTATPATILAKGGAARTLALEILARLAVTTAHEQVGAAEALLFIARDYALTRKAFGQPIGAFQSVKHCIAELYGLVEIARASCVHAASRDGQPDFLRAAAAARLSATEAYDTAARDCIQIHGGIGVTWDAGLHLHMRRARSFAIELGNMLFWEDLLVGELVGDVK